MVKVPDFNRCVDIQIVLINFQGDAWLLAREQVSKRGVCWMGVNFRPPL